MAYRSNRKNEVVRTWALEGFSQGGADFSKLSRGAKFHFPTQNLQNNLFSEFSKYRDKLAPPHSDAHGFENCSVQ